VALDRKILSILHHLLMNQEMYEEPGAPKRSRFVRDDQLSHLKKLSVLEILSAVPNLIPHADPILTP